LRESYWKYDSCQTEEDDSDKPHPLSVFRHVSSPSGHKNENESGCDADDAYGWSWSLNFPGVFLPVYGSIFVGRVKIKHIPIEHMASMMAY